MDRVVRLLEKVYYEVVMQLFNKISIFGFIALYMVLMSACSSDNLVSSDDFFVASSSAEAKQVRSSSSDSSVNFNIVVMSGSNEVSSSSMNTSTDNRKIPEGTGYCARFNQNDSMSWRFTAIEGHTKSTYIYHVDDAKVLFEYETLDSSVSLDDCMWKFLTGPEYGKQCTENGLVTYVAPYTIGIASMKTTWNSMDGSVCAVVDSVDAYIIIMEHCQSLSDSLMNR